jgi:hypothetical protein
VFVDPVDRLAGAALDRVPGAGQAPETGRVQVGDRVVLGIRVRVRRLSRRSVTRRVGGQEPAQRRVVIPGAECVQTTQGSAQISVADGTDIAARTYYTPYGEIRNLLPALPTEHGWLGKTKDPTTSRTARICIGDHLYIGHP